MTPYGGSGTPGHGSTVNKGFLLTNITTCAGSELVCSPVIDRSVRGVRRGTTGVRSNPTARRLVRDRVLKEAGRRRDAAPPLR
jgi:hypothetical protein